MQDSHLGPNGVTVYRTAYREVLLYAGQPSLVFMMYIHTLHVSVDSVTTPHTYFACECGFCDHTSPRWVCGVTSIHHPQVWSMCVSYCHSTRVRERYTESCVVCVCVHACMRACACVCQCITCVNNHIVSMPTECNV